MQIAVLFIVTSVVFLVSDGLMLKFVVQPLFQQHLGSQLLDNIRAAPAVLFYLLYMCGILYFAGLPALREGSSATAFINGLLLGLVAYGTYELTSWTVMRNWTVSMVAVDLTWGAFVTGFSTWAGVLVAKMVSSG